MSGCVWEGGGGRGGRGVPFNFDEIRTHDISANTPKHLITTTPTNKQTKLIKERERQRQRQRDRERETETETDRQTDRECPLSSAFDFN